jgi:hypothetical protein
VVGVVPASTGVLTQQGRGVAAIRGQDQQAMFSSNGLLPTLARLDVELRVCVLDDQPGHAGCIGANPVGTRPAADLQQSRTLSSSRTSGCRSTLQW